MVGHRVIVVFVVWVSLSFLNGCAAFRSGETPLPASWPMSQGPGKQSISLIFTGEALVNGMRQDIPPQTIQAWQEVATKAYKDSGLFSDVKTAAAETDLRAEVHMLERGEADKAMAFLSGFTLTLLPASIQEEFVIKTTMKNREGKDLGTFEKSDRASVWIQFFLIFIMPFNWPNTVLSEMLYDLHRATISQAHGAGLLQTRQLTGPLQWARAAE